MALNLKLNYIIALFFFSLISDNVLAASDLVEQMQSHLYEGRTAKAAVIANIRLAEAPDDDQARFALGAVQFLRAVEHLGQSLYRYGLRSGEYQGSLVLLELPILRIPVPKNLDPQEMTYNRFRSVLQTFLSDLQTAEATLDKIRDQQIALQLNIGLIRLDLNSDGIGSRDEALWQIFNVVRGAPWLDEVEARKLLTDFDFSDVAWLQGYCHLLMAFSEFPLAYDWSNTFEIIFPSLFHVPSSPYHKFLQIYIEDVAKLKKIPKISRPDIPAGMNYSVYQESPEYKEYLRIDNLRAPYERRIGRIGLADPIAFIHLINWPVVEPVRLRNVFEHLEAMVRFSRENWKRILAEEIDYRRKEWIPNIYQTGVLPRMRISKQRIDSWQQFLNEFEAILQGKKLIPHWRVDEGINLRRMFFEPRTFDLVLLIQGAGALPYLEKGELSPIQDLLDGDFIRYFIWFN